MPPGHAAAPPGQAVQFGGEPLVPRGHPKQAVADAGVVVSGSAHTRGTHVAEPAAEGVVVAGQGTTPTRHEDCVASGKELGGQGVQEEEPGGANAVRGQRAQTAAVVAPTAAEAEPAGHGTHADAPSAMPYVPAGQALHEETLTAPGKGE
jgi:hypothetical protein